MLPTPEIYSIWPAVVPANTESKMTILANERAYLFHEGAQYQIAIVAVNSDESYYKLFARKYVDVVAHDGVITFSFLFEKEQEYTILLTEAGKTISTLHVYSLYEDLYRLTPLKGDLHSHSCRSDGERDPAAHAGHYREQGYDFLALTDHNRYYPGGEIDEVYGNANTGLIRIPGEEVHSPGSSIHIVHVGGKKSVADIYVNHRQDYENALLEYYKKVPDYVPENLRERYGQAMWATDAIHEAGGLAIFPHPFWRPKGSLTFNVFDEFAAMLLKSGMFDAYELVGAMEQTDLNRSVAFWADLRSEGYPIKVVGSSDVHAYENCVHFPFYYTICFAEKKEADSIVNAVRSGWSVAVESYGSDRTKQCRCYGSLRLVSYTQFLLKYYFPNTQRLAAGVGVAMRAYAMEEADISLVEQHNVLGEKYTARYLGRMAPALPSPAIHAFEEKWRAVQLTGPKTRGSHVDAKPGKIIV